MGLMGQGADPARAAASALQACSSWEQARAFLTGGRRLIGAVRLEALVAAARAWPGEVAAELESLVTPGMPGRAAVVGAILDSVEPGTSLADAHALATRLRLQDRDAFRHLVKPLVERHGHAPLEVLRHFGLAQDGLRGLDCRFTLNGRPAFSVLAEDLLDAHPAGPSHQRLMARLAQALADSRLGEADKLALAGRMAGRSDAQGLLPVLYHLGVEKGAVLALTRELASHCKLGDAEVVYLFTADEPMRLAAALGQQQLAVELLRKDESLADLCLLELSSGSRCELMAHGVKLVTQLHGTRFGSMAEALEFVRRTWGPGWTNVDTGHRASTLRALRTHFESLQPHPLVAGLFDGAQANPNPRVQVQRMSWAMDAALCLGALPDADMQQLAPDLVFLDARHAPGLRQRLTDALICDVHAHGGATNYAEFAASFARPHMRGFAMALFPLFADGGASPPEDLLAALRHDRMKDSRRLHATLEDLLKLAEGTRHLGAPVVRALLERAVPAAATAQERSDGLRRNIRLMTLLVQSLDLSPDPALKAALQELAKAEPGIDLAARLEPLLRAQMPGSAEAAQTQDAGTWSRVLFDNRQVESMLVYRMLMAAAPGAGRAAQEDMDEVLAALDRYADAAIWHPDPVAEFARIRYAPQASSHLAHLAAHAPAAYEAWQSSTPLPAGSNQSLAAGLKVVDTDGADDLFMCGTDVTGSCQSVTREPSENRALLGFVLDGKYRMLALQSTDGSTQARRMVRLMIEESSRKPILFIEGLYANAGIEPYGPEDQALIALAREKAKAMDCPLVCAYGEPMAGDEYPELAVSLGSPAPFEYVDADDEGVSRGEYELDAHVLKPQEEIERLWLARQTGQP